MLHSCGARGESAEISSFPRLWIDFTGIESVFSCRELSDHVILFSFTYESGDFFEMTLFNCRFRMDASFEVVTSSFIFFDVLLSSP